MASRDKLQVLKLRLHSSSSEKLPTFVSKLTCLAELCPLPLTSCGRALGALPLSKELFAEVDVSIVGVVRKRNMT